MFNSTTLEVAIGMALVYLLLSLFCTAVNEAIAGILGSRGRNLEEGIRSLFTEGKLTIPATGKSPAKIVGLVDAIYRHGLVQSLFRSGTGIGDGIAKDVKKLPSYIPARTFSATLFDLLFPSGDAAQAPGTAAPTPAEAQAARLRKMLDSLENISGGPAKEAIATLVKQADGDIERTRKAFERWYNDGMDRVSGWYKRRTQRALFIIGMFLAVALNVDSVRVAEVLWKTPALRSYAISSADQYVKNHSSVAASGDAASKPADPDPASYIASLKSLNLPLGWDPKDLDWIAPSKDNSLWLARICWPQFALVVAGWLMTAIAMTLGAPFWFDLLNQFMVIRSTIKPEEKSGAEGSKDPQ